MEICEIFRSVQGEGWRQGSAAVFVRLAGCNLRCAFCDTRYAWGPGRRVSPEDAAGEARALGAPLAVVTGGEPMMQDLAPLVGALHAHGFEVAVETNGTRWQECGADWLTVSPKREALKEFPLGYDERFLPVADEFKYVLRSAEEVAFIDTRVAAPVILQPVDNDLRVARLLAGALERAGRKNWFLRMRLHALLGVR